MDVYQLKSFAAVARAGTITRAAALVHLSQPAVSAHIKALEDALGIALFTRTARGMVLTTEGTRLLAKAERALLVHQELLDEATRMKGSLAGTLRLGAGANSPNEAIGRLLATFAERWPEVQVTLRHGTSQEILDGIRDGSLDAGFYNEAGAPPPDLSTVEVARFGTYVAAAPGLVAPGPSPDWPALAGLTWIYPTASSCCAKTAEDLFQRHGVRPVRVVSVDRERLTRSLLASGLGVGLLHEATARAAARRGEVELIAEAPSLVRVLLAYPASRAGEPLLTAATSILEPSGDL